jgi:effector-binding domain-containing protein
MFEKSFRESAMGIIDHGLDYKKVGERLVASIRQPVSGRGEILDLFQELADVVTPENRTGDFFWIRHYINSLDEGIDAEAAVPVRRAVEVGRIATRVVPELQVLWVRHDGPAETLSESYRKFGAASGEFGLISEEFIIESFQSIDQLIDGPIEVQYVLHDWSGLFQRNLERVVGAEQAKRIFGEMDSITVDTPLEERKELTLCAVSRLTALGQEYATYDVISSCAHVFPDSQTEKLRLVFQQEFAKTQDKIKAIDAVLEFMDSDPGWRVEIYREGDVIYTAKNPRDRAAFEAAQTDEERRRAYCFCPIIRNHLEEDVPPEFCYCGSGWYRKQWEDATQKPVSIEIVKSLVKGDDRCQYAITILD